MSYASKAVMTTPDHEGESSRPMVWRSDWRKHCERRHDKYFEHSAAMEALLSKYPDQIPWLERHGFSVQDLIESLKWYPAQQLGEMESAPPEEREGRYATLEEVSEENFDRLEANLVKVLPLVAEVQAMSKAILKTQIKHNKASRVVNQLTTTCS